MIPDFSPGHEVKSAPAPGGGWEMRVEAPGAFAGGREDGIAFADSC